MLQSDIHCIVWAPMSHCTKRYRSEEISPGGTSAICDYVIYVPPHNIFAILQLETRTKAEWQSWPDWWNNTEILRTVPNQDLPSAQSSHRIKIFIIKDQGRPLCPPSGLVWCSNYSTEWWFIFVNVSTTSTLLVRLPTRFSKVSWWMLLFLIDTNNHWKILVSPKDHLWKVRMMPSFWMIKNFNCLVALRELHSYTF